VAGHGKSKQGSCVSSLAVLLGGSVLLLVPDSGALLGGAVVIVELVVSAATTHLQRQHVWGLSPLSLPEGISASRLHVTKKIVSVSDRL
jgi:hypothetical protein